MGSLINPQTGFIDTNYLGGFSSIKKLKFIELALEATKNGLYPNIEEICKSVDITSFTFFRHKREDPKFNQAWKETLDAIEHKIIGVMTLNAQDKRGFMDRIAWLRWHKPQEWNPEHQLKVSHEISVNKSVFDEAKTVIEAELVDKREITSTPKQVVDKSI